ncbi:MAG: response regulator [Desulfomonile sp.]
MVQESVRRLLEDQGFSVDAVPRVDQALELLKKKTYDLILTDLMMRGRNGMELVEALALEYPETGIIMFTGHPTVSSAVESIKLGALDYLPKPFTPDERNYDDKEMDLIAKFSKQGALAIENAIIYETMRKDIEGMKK